MAKKTAPQKTLAKKAVSKTKAPVKKPAPVKKKPSPAKKTEVVKSKPHSKAALVAPVNKSEPAQVPKTAFEAPSAKPVPVSPVHPAKVVMKTGAGGATSLTISAQSSAGAAANGNTHPANILVLVSSGGWPVTDLTKDHFTLMEYFEVPGQQAPFSNNVTSFRNVGTGAYLLQVKPINGAPWRSGHHLAQILVSSADDRQGQGAVKLIIR